MKYVVLDTETNIKNTGEGAVGNNAGSPFHPDNRIVALGELINHKVWMEWQPGFTEEHDPPYVLQRAAHGQDVLMVGANLAFDLAYLAKTWPEMWDAARPHLFIWDVQQGEYLISGHLRMYASLDEMAVEAGGTLKDNRMKEYWDQGIDTTLIPQDITLPYLEADLLNTELVFLKQWKYLSQPGNEALLTLAKIKMDDILMTSAMQIHGMKFDVEYAARRLDALDFDIELTKEKLLADAAPYFVEGYDWDAASDDDVAVLLFGGEYKREEDVVKRDPDTNEPLFYKSGDKAGQIKTRREKVKRTTKGLGLKPGKTPKMKNGNYSTQEKFLAKIKHPFIDNLLKLREWSKDAETYFRGFSKVVWPDGFLHPNFNNAATGTGRQSASNPNLQNVTKDDE
jgi:DNA polymerase I